MGARDDSSLHDRYAFDSLGNIVESHDDLDAFWDRSLGAQAMDPAKPYQLRFATNEPFTPPNALRGWLDAQYDDAGNLTAMIVRRTANMTPSGSSGWQRFAYAWDEVGRLMSASRWDLASSRDYAVEHDVSSRLENPPPSRTADAKMAYVYDGADERVVKTTTDRNNVARHTVDVFANYKLRLTTEAATAAGSDYTLDGTTERVELQSHGVTVGRVETMATGASTLATPGQRVLLVLHDALGSAGIVLDRESGELAEAVTYTAYGQTESDLRPERFGSNREDERFTGKEEDVEVGLVYFGKRYLVPAMARWASADPLAVHAPGEADLNLYAYVHGRVFVAVDLEGLEDAPTHDVSASLDAFSELAKSGAIRGDNAAVGKQIKALAMDGFVDVKGRAGTMRAYFDVRLLEDLVSLATATKDSGGISLQSLARWQVGPNMPDGNRHGRRVTGETDTMAIMAADISSIGGHRVDLSGNSNRTGRFAWNSRQNDSLLAVAELKNLARHEVSFGLPRAGDGVLRGDGTYGQNPSRDVFVSGGPLGQSPGNCAGNSCLSHLQPEGATILNVVMHQPGGPQVKTMYPDAPKEIHLQVEGAPVLARRGPAPSGTSE